MNIPDADDRLVCQLAKAHGAYVVGSAGSDEKCEWLLKEAKIDKAINYKKEKNLDAAWTAANQGNCERDLLITLAGKLEATRPDHAIGLYRRVVPSIVEQTGNAAYEEAIGLVRKVGRLMKAPKQSRQFGDYLSELRVQFKPKRNFIKLLDAVVRQGAG